MDEYFGFAYSMSTPNYSWEDGPDFDEYIEECEYYSEALGVDLEIAAAFADGRIEYVEVV